MRVAGTTSRLRGGNLPMLSLLLRLGGVFIAALMLVIASAGSAEARWLRAESPRFIVYSDGDERSLREYVQQLEVYDAILRWRHGIDPGGIPQRKLELYLVGNQRQLQAINPRISTDTLGFYWAGDTDLFGTAVRARGDMATTFHEYAHHFMFQHFAAGYPSWLVEGYAEYFMTAEIRPNRIRIGLHNENRAYWLANASWMPLEVILTRNTWEMGNSEAVAMYYAQSWALTHYFLGDAVRVRQLLAYVHNIRAGLDSVEAMETATGMTIRQLNEALQRYVRAGIPVTVLRENTFPVPDVTVTTLPPSADDLILLRQRLRAGWGREDDEVLGLIRQRAARHRGDRMAELTLASAEIMRGDRPSGQAILSDWISAHPDDAEALQAMGWAYLLDLLDGPRGEALGTEDHARINAQMDTARGYLARAYQADPDDYRTLMMLSTLRTGSPDFPNENDLNTLYAAFELAPQVSTVRFAYARALLHASEYNEAINVLLPLATDPHSRTFAAHARGLIEQAEMARAGLLIEWDDEIVELPLDDEDAPVRFPPRAHPSGAALW
jgi:Flp pilus assembly protein TadD